jgi:acetolactate synthase-1/2/3 large subunit
MVLQQEILKYGRGSGCQLGPYDPVKYAEAFGATGMMIRTADEIAPTLARAMDSPGPVIIGVPVDYSDNPKLFQAVSLNAFR